jgi:hypothetical protein
MKRFLMHAAALILGLAVTGAAVAAKGTNSGSSSHNSHGSAGSSPTYPGSYSSWNGSGYHHKFTPPNHEQDKGKLLPGSGYKYKTKPAGMPKTFGPNGSKFNGKPLPYGKTFKATNGKSYTYQSCPQHLQHYCKSWSYCGWTHYCSFPSWNCCGCWCPVARCWYYWYEPYCCYLPCSCMNQYPPVQCCDPDTLMPPPDDPTTDGGSTTDLAPLLPPGASLLPRS